MTQIGRRMSPAGKLHLLKLQEHDRSWMTVCGRKIKPEYALSPEQFNFTVDDCCSCCSYKYKHPAA
jgi:hypothetical protein